MTATHDGGHAYPTAFTESDSPGRLNSFAGLTKRDYFAGQALMGIVAGHRQPYRYDDSDTARLAERSYQIADAMLKVRDGQ
jgi:hypothetical protein